MASVTVNTIRNAVIDSLDRQFPDIKIHGEEIAQGFKEPCFYVKLFPVEQNQVMGNRYKRYHTFDIHYFPKSEYANEEMHDMAEQLYELMEYIEYGDSIFRGMKMKHEIYDGVLHFFVSYDFFLMKKEEKVYMELLEQHSTTKG